ncbi:MAG: nucleotidyltransferase domain-containing protein [Deltaproteobacteria bacterium]|nr:nucleotidyltransferase domain-containing protein [Deltaproteobacteria bacterium]
MKEKRFFKTNVLSDEQRAAVVKTVKERLFEDLRVSFAYIHGSFAEGVPFRDVDVAAYLKPEGDALGFEADTSYELGERAGLPVDVKAINSAPPTVRMAVLRKGILLFARDEAALADFVEDAGRRYAEYAHFRDIYLGT